MNRTVQYQSSFTPPEQIFSKTPQGFTAFFDRGNQPGSAAQFAFDSFECHQPIVLPTTMGTSAFFDRGKQPGSAAEQPYSSFTPRGRIDSITPQGFNAFFDPGRQPGSAAQQPYSAFTARGAIAVVTPQGFSAFFEPRFTYPISASLVPFGAFLDITPPLQLFGVFATGQVGSLIADFQPVPLGVFATGMVGTVTFQITNAGGYSLYHGPERDSGPRPLVRKRVARKQTLPEHAKPEGSVERPTPLPPFANLPQVALPMRSAPSRPPVDFSGLAPRNPIQLGQTIKDAHAKSEEIEAIRILTELGLLQ